MRIAALLSVSALLAGPAAGQSPSGAASGAAVRTLSGPPSVGPSSGPSGSTPAQAVLPSRPTNAGGGPAWSSLSLAHQAALAPLKAHWHNIDAPRRQKWVEVAQRFPTMPQEERQRVQARMAEWAALSPTERGHARQNFQELRSLPTEDRHARWEAYQALPPEQRHELANRAQPVAGKPADPRPAVVKPGDGKRKVAVNPTTVVVKPVTPTVVQAKPGASTTLVTRTPAPPVHHQPGLPKITASAGFVNPSTLLPNRGPQGAAVVLPAASGSPVRAASATSSQAASTTASAASPGAAGATAASSAPVAASGSASAP